MAETVADLVPDATAKALGDYANEAPPPLDKWQSATGCWMVPVDWILPARDARKTYDSQEDLDFKNGIAELKADKKGIEQTGIDTPILLKPDPRRPGRYLATAGRRRWKFSQELGTVYIPAAIRDISDKEGFRQSVRENIARRGLDPAEAGEAFLEMRGEGDTVAEIAASMNVSEGYVNNRIRAAEKPEDIKEMIHDATTKTRSVMAHADEIDKVTDPVERKRLVEKVVKEKAPLEDIKEEVKKLDRIGKVKRRGTLGSTPPTNGSIGNKVKPATVYVDWGALDKAGRDATFNIMRNIRDHKPKTKENRDKMIDALAAMEKDIREARQLLGSELD
jgi:ParB/RepB/Spo0J family partition protein